MFGITGIFIELLFRFWYIIPLLFVFGIYSWRKNRKVAVILILVPIVICVTVMIKLLQFSSINTPHIELRSLEKLESSLNENSSYMADMDVSAYRTLNLYITIKVDRTLQPNEINELKSELILFLKSEELRSDIDKFMLDHNRISQDFSDIYTCVTFEDNILLEISNSDY